MDSTQRLVVMIIRLGSIHYEHIVSYIMVLKLQKMNYMYSTTVIYTLHIR